MVDVARRTVTHLLGQRHGLLAHRGARISGSRTWRALPRSLSGDGAEWSIRAHGKHGIAVFIGQHLNLDMPRIDEIFFHEYARVVELDFASLVAISHTVLVLVRFRMMRMPLPPPPTPTIMPDNRCWRCASFTSAIAVTPGAVRTKHPPPWRFYFDSILLAHQALAASGTGPIRVALVVPSHAPK